MYPEARPTLATSFSGVLVEGMRVSTTLMLSLTLLAPCRAFVPLTLRSAPRSLGLKAMHAAPEIRSSTRRLAVAIGRRDGFGAARTPGLLALQGSRQRGAAPLCSAASGDAEEGTLQEELWAQFDVLPGVEESLVELRTTQDTGVCDLGLVARRDVEMGEVPF